MFRRGTLALALVSALTGCVSAPPAGAFVEYRDGETPATTPVKYEATYALRSSAQPSEPLTEHHVMKGERIGFRREPDGSVSAVGPGYALALAPGAYSWDVVPGTAPSWHERVWRDAHDPAVALKDGTWFIICASCVLVVGAGLLFVFAKGGGGSTP